MKDSLKIIKLMDLEELYFMMVLIMKENGKMIFAKDKVNQYIQMDKLKKVNGKITNFKIENYYNY